MQKRRLFLFLALLSLIVTSIACSLPILSLQNQESRDQASVVDTTSNLQQNSEIEPPTLPSQGEVFSYRVTEAQLTSMLRDANLTRSDLGITNPVIYLRNGQVELQGTGSLSGLQLPLSIEVRLFVDPSGQLQYEITSAKLGVFSVPNIILDQITEYIDQTIEQSLAIDRRNIRIESISIENGVLSISGRLR